jgi:hypothetical protein
LPKVQQSNEFVPPPYVDGRFQKVKNEADKVRAGQMSHEDFTHFVDTTIELIMEKEATIRDTEIPSEAVEDFREEMEMGLAGIDLFCRGLAEMRVYVEDEDGQHLDAGLELVRDGNGMLNNAIMINRRNRHKLEEMYIDASTTL